MNYHKAGSYSGRTYAWGEHSNTYSGWYSASEQGKNSVADLFYDLGLPENLNMQYGAGGSFAYTEIVSKTLLNFGYALTFYKDFDWGKAVDNIMENRPIYVSGTKRGSNSGHAWVVDGLQIDEYSTVYRVNYWYEGHLQGSEYVKRNIQSLFNYLHVNWGWDGSYDCWTRSGVFQLSGNDYAVNNLMVASIRPR